MSTFGKSEERAFWSKVDICDKNKCWDWLGVMNPKGYGNVRINKRYLKSHRVSWEISNFEIPAGYIVMHVCDNPSCCNPAHLMLGTNQSNFCDMIFKGREQFKKNKAIGVRNTNAKLTDESVRQIRKLYSDGSMDQYKLATKFGVSQSNIGSIVRNETWRHVA